MINLNITARNFELREDMKNYIEKRLSKIERFSNHIIKSNLIFEEQRGQYSGEIIIEVTKKGILKAKASNSDFFTVVDELKDKIINQLKKYEQKLKGK
ncbi:MAG: ribosome-associated translation inhibitor RaiA [candidate division WOR-3 bacterium]